MEWHRPQNKNLSAFKTEVRSNVPGTRISRGLFYVDKRGRMVLLHGFIKKTQKTPDEDLKRAASNKSKHERGLK